MIVYKGYYQIVLVASLMVGLVFYECRSLERLLQQGLVIGKLEETQNVRLSEGGDDAATANASEKKMCVIFAGPHKTGSTTVERFVRDTTVKPALEEDNYVDYGQRARTLASCFCDDDTKIRKGYTLEYCDEMLKDFKTFIDTNTGKSNILLAHEEFDLGTLDVKMLSNYLSPHFNIHVVVHYRRFYDWMFSGYNQIHKDDNHQHTGPMRTFGEWLPHTIEEYFYNQHSAAVFKRYDSTPGVYNVSIVNMHNNDPDFDVVEAFACDHLDDAPHTCEAAKSRPEETNLNPSVSINWTVFSGKLKNYYAAVEELNDEDWEKIREKFNSMTNLPKVCLPDDLKDKLLQLSLEAETAVMPEWFYNSQEGLLAMISDFQKNIETKMCDIDVEAIATSSEWQGFMEGLDIRKRHS